MKRFSIIFSFTFFLVTKFTIKFHWRDGALVLKQNIFFQLETDSYKASNYFELELWHNLVRINKFPNEEPTWYSSGAVIMQVREKYFVLKEV